MVHEISWAGSFDCWVHDPAGKYYYHKDSIMLRAPWHPPYCLVPASNSLGAADGQTDRIG